MKSKKYKALRLDQRSKNIQIHDYYMGCDWIPRICVQADREEIYGQSLVDPQEPPKACSRVYCNPTRITKQQAHRYKRNGLPHPYYRKAYEAFCEGEWGNGRLPWW